MGQTNFCDKCNKELKMVTIKEEGYQPYSYVQDRNQVTAFASFHGNSTTHQKFGFSKDLCNECFEEVKELIVKWFNNGTL